MKIKSIVLSALYFISLSASDLNQLPERQWLIHQYLPHLAGRILFVGVNYYTAQYHTYVQTPETFETMDLLTDRAHFGSPYKHYIQDFLTFESPYQYDHICLFGVMGVPGNFGSIQSYTIVDEPTITQALEHATRLLKIGGTLQLGPDRRTLPHYNANYWSHRFTQHPLTKYQVIVNEVGPFNMMWWGKKVTD